MSRNSLIRDASSTSSFLSRVRASPRKKLPNCNEISELEQEVTEQKDSHYRRSLARQMDTKFHLSQSAMTLSRFQNSVAPNETLTQTPPSKSGDGVDSKDSSCDQIRQPPLHR